MTDTTIIWESFKNELFGFILSRVHDQNAAKDILQDVFFKIHSNIDKLRDEQKVSSWVYQISRNTIIDHYRSNSKNIISNDLTVEQNVELPIEEARDFEKCMLGFIDELPDNDKEILQKTAIEGLSQKDYARQYGLSYTATKSRVQRARKKLKELFLSCCNVVTDSYGNIIETKEEDCSCGC